MWFSTWNGISYYDGNSFHTFRDEADDIDLLSTNRFMDIYATSRNNVWCITAGRHLYAYETILCTFVPVGDNINKLYNIDLRVDKIYNIKQGNTWVTTKSGDYLIRIKGLQREGNIPELIKVGKTDSEAETYGISGQIRKNANGFSPTREPPSTTLNSALPSPSNG